MALSIEASSRRRLALHTPLGDQATLSRHREVDAEDDHGPEQTPDETSGSEPIEVTALDQLRQKPSDECADDAQERRDDDTHRLPPGNQGARQQADDKNKQDEPENTHGT